MENFVLKKNNKAYSLEELKDQNVTADTKIRYENKSEWTTAIEIDELQTLIAINNSYADIRASNQPHVRKPYLGELMLLGIVLGFIQLLVPVERAFDEQNLFSISVSKMSPEKVYAYSLVALIILGVYIYNYFTYRYYRIVKMREEDGKKVKTYYQIQSTVSLKKRTEELEDIKPKWRVEQFHNCIYKKREAKTTFDKLTAKKVITETPQTEIKQRYKKPNLLDKLRQESSLVSSIFDNSEVLPFIILPIGFITVEILMIITDYFNTISPEQQSNITIYFLASLPLIFLISKLYIKNTKCYMRVIRREIQQGLIEDDNYHIQYFLSKKSLSEVQKSSHLNWKDRVFKKRVSRGKSSYSTAITSESKLKSIFYKQTRSSNKKIKQVAMD